MGCLERVVNGVLIAGIVGSAAKPIYNRFNGNDLLGSDTLKGELVDGNNLLVTATGPFNALATCNYLSLTRLDMDMESCVRTFSPIANQQPVKISTFEDGTLRVESPSGSTEVKIIPPAPLPQIRSALDTGSAGDLQPLKSLVEDWGRPAALTFLLAYFNIVFRGGRRREHNEHNTPKSRTGNRSTSSENQAGYNGSTEGWNTDGWRSSFPDATVEQMKQYIRDKVEEIATRRFGEYDETPIQASKEAIFAIMRDFETHFEPIIDEAYKGWGDSRLREMLEEVKSEAGEIFDKAQDARLQEIDRMAAENRRNPGEILDGRIDGNQIFVPGASRPRK